MYFVRKTIVSPRVKDAKLTKYLLRSDVLKLVPKFSCQSRCQEDTLAMGLINTVSEITIPIIDFTAWSIPNSSSSERLAVAKSLADACHNVGFVFITNHGVPPNLLEEAFSWSKRLFDLKTEDKMLAPHPDGPTVHRGYSWPGLEKVSQVISQDMEVGEKLRQVTDCKVWESSQQISSDMVAM